MVAFSGDLSKHAGKLIRFVSIFKDKSLMSGIHFENGRGKKYVMANKNYPGNM
jgi:hypothetical protein